MRFGATGVSACFHVGALRYLSDDGEIVVPEQYEMKTGCFANPKE